MTDPGKGSRQSARGAWRVDFKGMKSRESMLKAVAVALAFPAHFGVNLDALYDCLTDLPLESGSTPSIELADLARTPAGDCVHAVFVDAVEYWRDKGITLAVRRD